MIIVCNLDWITSHHAITGLGRQRTQWGLSNLAHSVKIHEERFVVIRQQYISLRDV